MKNWQEDLLDITHESVTEEDAFLRIEAASYALGFENCAYGLRVPLPLSNPHTIMLNNYGSQWQRRYAQEGFLQIDPTVLHGRKTQAPLIWSDDVFAQTPAFWEEAKSHGLRVGWA